MRLATLDAAAIRDSAARIVAEHPGPNVLVNNAGILRVEGVLAGPDALATAEAAIHSYGPSLRHQPRNTPVQVIGLAPPLVAKDLTPGQRDDPRALPREDFIRVCMALLAADPDAAEILVERVTARRTAGATGRFAAVLDMINPR